MKPGGVILSRQWTTKALIRQKIASLLLSYGITSSAGYNRTKTVFLPAFSWNFCSGNTLENISKWNHVFSSVRSDTRKEAHTGSSKLILLIGPLQANLSSSIPSWQVLTAHAQPFIRTRDLAFCLKVPLDSLLVWASSGGSGETARMRRLAWTFAARIGDKYQIRLTRSNLCIKFLTFRNLFHGLWWALQILSQG